MLRRDPRPLVAHVVFRFDVGGLENGVVNLINRMPESAYRHMVVSLTDVTAFSQRVQRQDVEFVALHKAPGHALRLYPRLWRLFRATRPAIVHTRNLAALECTLPAWAAGVPARIHGEHGRDVSDLDGSNRTYQWVRRAYSPFVSHYVALSADLAGYLRERVHLPAAAISQIYNGVDCDRFHPSGKAQGPAPGCPFEPGRHWLVGTVGRMQQVKDQANLVRAFVLAMQRQPGLRDRVRLVMVGGGPTLDELRRTVEQAGLADLCWMPGERNDVPDVMRTLDCFVLPSLAEGISNTILEAMACGLPVIATRVGGNAELIAEGESGLIVPSADAPALADAITELATQPARARAMGVAGRLRAETQFSLQSMVGSYQSLYDRLLRR